METMTLDQEYMAEVKPDGARQEQINSRGPD